MKEPGTRGYDLRNNADADNNSWFDLTALSERISDSDVVLSLQVGLEDGAENNKARGPRQIFYGIVEARKNRVPTRGMSPVGSCPDAAVDLGRPVRREGQSSRWQGPGGGRL